MLNLILDAHQEVELKENHIHHLHKTLLQVISKDESHRGNYKKLSNKVVAKYPGGLQKIIFNTTEPFLVNGEMNDLLTWSNENFKKEELHPLIIIGTFVYEFLSIHPYQDGNGRLSRLLTTLLLIKCGYDFMEYASMEIEIEKRKKEYYKALMNGQKNRGTSKEIIDDWIIFFLETLENTIKKLEDRYSKIKERKTYLNDRQKELVKFIEINQPVKISDIISAMIEHTPYTLKKDIKYLVDEGVIKKIGKARATIYLIDEKRKKD